VEDLSLHILDVVENAIRAHAQRISIMITEDIQHDQLAIEIKDNGTGMSEKLRKKALDPFTTTKTTSRIGLGLPLFEQAARMSGGEFSLSSETNRGTIVRATFKHSHVDRKPMGNIAQTILTLIAGNPAINFIYTHTKQGVTYALDTNEWKKELDGIPLNHPEVLRLIREELAEQLVKIGVT
jgi:anti-sigma regulatory factor (Ser/Thr protein kinase)